MKTKISKLGYCSTHFFCLVFIAITIKNELTCINLQQQKKKRKRLRKVEMNKKNQYFCQLSNINGDVVLFIDKLNIQMDRQKKDLIFEIRVDFQFSRASINKKTSFKEVVIKSDNEQKFEVFSGFENGSLQFWKFFWTETSLHGHQMSNFLWMYKKWLLIFSSIAKNFKDASDFSFHLFFTSPKYNLFIDLNINLDVSINFSFITQVK